VNHTANATYIFGKFCKCSGIGLKSNDIQMGQRLNYLFANMRSKINEE